jgi:uncharacterized protein (TIGR00251 family)
LSTSTEAVIVHSLRNGQVVFKVQVVPRSSRSEVVGEHDGALRVRIAAPPVDGAANEEVIRILAKTFNVSRTAVKIVSGHSGKLKQISIEGSTNDIAARLNRDSWT